MIILTYYFKLIAQRYFEKKKTAGQSRKMNLPSLKNADASKPPPPFFLSLQAQLKHLVSSDRLLPAITLAFANLINSMQVSMFRV